MINELITKLDNWLRGNRPDYYAKLQPGASLEALTAFEEQFTLTLPEPFRKLYQWRNGQPANEFASFQDNLMFSSLEEVAKSKEMLDGMIGTDFDDPEWWRPSWIPFLSNGGGDYICLDLAAEDGGTPGQLLAYWHDDEERDIEYDSLEEWLRALVESMEDGTLDLV